ncbi:hypothetical protein J2W21_003917, partial [Sinomonas atrocyanea]|nr:hypothetical protein [Sinomonas atrocyanea]
GRVYPAFTGVVLLPSLLRALRRSTLTTLRAATTQSFKPRFTRVAAAG